MDAKLTHFLYFDIDLNKSILFYIFFCALFASLPSLIHLMFLTQFFEIKMFRRIIQIHMKFFYHTLYIRNKKVIFALYTLIFLNFVICIILRFL